MALGTPQGPSQSRWTVTCDSRAQVAEYPVTFAVTATTDNPDDPAMAAVVQQFVDLIAKSPDFVLRTAGRASTYLESMTPTA